MPTGNRSYPVGIFYVVSWKAKHYTISYKIYSLHNAIII